MRKRTVRRCRPGCDLLEERRLLLGYTPAQITAAYALNALSFTSPSGSNVTGDGTGQTIALVETYHDPNIQSSLDGFDAQYGLPKITLNVVDLAGNQTDQGWAAEETLDVEWCMRLPPERTSKWWRQRRVIATPSRSVTFFPRCRQPVRPRESALFR